MKSIQENFKGGIIIRSPPCFSDARFSQITVPRMLVTFCRHIGSTFQIMDIQDAEHCPHHRTTVRELLTPLEGWTDVHQISDLPCHLQLSPFLQAQAASRLLSYRTGSVGPTIFARARLPEHRRTLELHLDDDILHLHWNPGLVPENLQETSAIPNRGPTEDYEEYLLGPHDDTIGMGQGESSPGDKEDEQVSRKHKIAFLDLHLKVARTDSPSILVYCLPKEVAQDQDYFWTQYGWEECKEVWHLPSDLRHSHSLLPLLGQLARLTVSHSPAIFVASKNASNRRDIELAVMEEFISMGIL
jgi:hypothetical protein